MRWWRSKEKPEPRRLRGPIERHLGVDLADAQSVAHEVKPIQRVNLQRVLDRWVAEASPAVEAVGFSSTGYFTDDGLVKYLITDELIQAPVERIQVDSGPAETLDCVLRGLYLFRHTLATRLLAAGHPLKTIADVLGHASSDTTYGYTRVELRALHSVAIAEAEVCS